MNKHKIAHYPLTSESERSTATEEHYYVQRITEQVFVIRERTPDGGEPGPHDRIIKSFDMRHDAYIYVDTLNEQQRKRDAEKKAE